MNLKHLEVTKELHTTIKTAAATEGITLKALTERLIRLGLVAPRLACTIQNARGDNAMCAWCGKPNFTGFHDKDCPAQAALAAYDAALNDGKETA